VSVVASLEDFRSGSDEGEHPAGGILRCSPTQYDDVLLHPTQIYVSEYAVRMSMLDKNIGEGSRQSVF